MVNTPDNSQPKEDRRAFALILQAGEQLQVIARAVDKTVALYDDERPDVWSMQTRTPDATWLRTVLMDLWHTDDLPGHFTSRHTAIIAASPSLREAFHAINNEKRAFRAITDEIKNRARNKQTAHSEMKAELARRHPELRAHLNTAGMARLSIKKAWRQVFVFDAPVRSLGLTWHVNGRSIVKLSVAEARAHLEKLGADKEHIQIQLDKLATLPAGEVLAQVHSQTPMLRCNMQFVDPIDGSEDGNTRLAMNTSMPIVVPPDLETGMLPPMRTPPHKPRPSNPDRKRRKDAKIESEPFLPSIHAYRYLSEASSEA